MFIPDLFLIISIKTNAKKNSTLFEWKQMLENDSNFLKSVITSDETWVYQFDPFTKSATNV